MAEQINSYCSICGKGYHVCLSCNRTKILSPWKIHTDTSEHYKIYQILHGYLTGVYSKSEAKNKLQKVDLSDLENFKERIKIHIKTILEEENKIEIDNDIGIDKNSSTFITKPNRKKKNT